ncbi:hypothetical protein CLV46_2557 [Diaminobutyricimonas aerilata]|uniref:Uncharacterized protein n=2 Tax=Diaminobutyricimonas aerilata TaxID=1162967 RepID=A0A2M9CM42_9MICO|nr:hypothetical protein CLV46_2557 [Diaminobutyricimonas aerilata]
MDGVGTGTGPSEASGAYVAELGPTLSSSFGNPAAVTALVIPPAVISVLALVPVSLLSPNAASLLNGAIVPVDPPTWFPVVQSTLLVLWAIALAFGSAAAAFAVAARAGGIRASVTDAWREAGRRALPLSIVFIVLGIIGAAVTGATLALAAVSHVAVALVFIAVAIVVIAPILAAPSTALLARRGPFAALRHAASVPRWSRDAVVARTRMSLGVGLGVALALGTVWLTRDLEGSVLAVLLRDVLRAAALYAGVLFAIGWLTTVAVEAREIGRFPWQVTPVRVRHPSRALALIGLVAVVAAPILGGLVAAVNPGGLARITVAEAGRHWEDIEAVPLGDGAAVFSSIGDEGGRTSICLEATCRDFDSPHYGGVSAVGLPNGSVLYVRVGPVLSDGHNFEQIEVVAAKFEPSEAAGVPERDEHDQPVQLRLTADDDPLGTASTLWTEDLDEDAYGDPDQVDDTVTTIGLDARGLPVVALLTASEVADYGTLRVFRCSDDACTDSKLSAQADVLWQYPFASAEWAMADMVVLPDGTVGVAVVHPHNGPAPLQFVAFPPEGDPTVTVLDDMPREMGIGDRDRSSGVRAAVNGEGTATLAWRALGEMTGHLLTCGDATCSTHTTVDTLPSGSDPYYPSATLAIDDSGRPLYLRRDVSGVVRLVSCEDVTCATTSETALAMPEYPGGPMALTLGVDGRPIIVAAAPPVDRELERRITERSLVLECADLRCGLN